METLIGIGAVAVIFGFIAWKVFVSKDKSGPPPPPPAGTVNTNLPPGIPDNRRKL